MDLITEVDILKESKDCFLTYAEEVLTERSIPSAEDGLLSVHRKILWTLEDLLKMNNKSKTKKSASIVGSTLASSYFHGDAACYGALCKMAQTYLMRYPLIDGQGSLGTQEANGMEASARYTEAKPSKYADLMMNDFKKDVVPKVETYNGEYFEPVVLPSIFPNAIVNGREAIGVSMAHNSLPANLTEVCDGIIEYIKKDGKITIEEIMKYIQGPDFPLGGTVINSKDILDAYKTGHSSISLKVRGDYEIKDNNIIFTSIPYRTYRNKIKEQINKNIDELEKVIEDFNDESNLGNNRLIFTVKKGVAPETAVNKLFMYTDLQTSLSYNMNFIVNGTPKLCSLLDLINAYVNHQNNILINAATFDKNKAEARIHVLKGLLLAVDKINEVINIIKGSKDKSEANTKLINFLSIDDIQANAILDMKLARLTKINKQELVDELKEKELELENCVKIINDKKYRSKILIEKIEDMKNKYGDKRRTKLLNLEIPKEDKEIAAVTPEDVVVMLSQTGDIKRIPKSSFKTQRKGGKGIKTADDAIMATIKTNTIDALLLFTNKGKMYRMIVDNIPVGTNISKGVNVSTLVNLEPDEKVIAITNLARENENKYVVFITKQGLLKKTLLEEYTKTKRSTGIAAINLKDGDSIANIELMNEEDIIIITKQGYSIHFETKDIAAIGRVTAGVKAIKLTENDEVLVGLPIRNNNNTIAIFSSIGNAKKTNIEEFPLQGRTGKGVVCYKVSPSTGEVIGATMINDEDNILLIGNHSICINEKDIPLLSRNAIGNIMIKDSFIKNIVKI